MKKNFFGKIFGREKPEANLEKKFGTIFEKNLFEGKESISGPGSDLKQTEKVRSYLPDLFQRLQIKSFLDAPCGDFFWMQHVPFGEVHYTGADIVRELVDRNNAQYGNNKREFIFADIVNGDLPKVDVIFCRDCLVHLTYEQAQKAIANFKRSGSTYLLTTTFPGRTNRDLGDIIWRPLNLQQEPFRFPGPVEIFNEGCTENNGRYSDKSLGLWKLSQLG